MTGTTPPGGGEGRQPPPAGGAAAAGLFGGGEGRGLRRGKDGYAEDAYPFRSFHEHLHRVFDAFGPERMFRGTDITRMPWPCGGNA